MHICKVPSILRSCVAIVWVTTVFYLNNQHTCKVTSFLSVIPSAMHLSCSKILLFNSQCALANLKETIKHANCKEDNSIKNLPHLYNATKYWNSLPTDLKECNFLSILLFFKSKLKTFFKRSQLILSLVIFFNNRF